MSPSYVPRHIYCSDKSHDSDQLVARRHTLTSSLLSFLAASLSFLFSASISLRTRLSGASRVSYFSTHTYDLAV